jgi:hypothetical protein
MLSILITIGWLIAIACMVYLAAQAIRNRFYARRRRKVRNREIREFKKHHHFDQKSQRWVRNVDGVAMVDEAAEDHRLMLTLLGWISLIAWEVYWIWEIVERFRTTTSPLQLPYFFLFIVLVGIPLVIYLFFRRRMRRPSYPL